MKSTIFVLACGLTVAGCNRNPTTTSNAAPGVGNQQSVPQNQGYASSGSSVSTPTTNPDNAAVNANYSSPPATQPDNTGINTRDQNADAVTPPAQGESKSDIDMTAEIRRRIMQASLSVNAQNVKVVTQNGKVTLRGPVNNQDEKNSIDNIANQCAGSSNVSDQLDIKNNAPMQ